MRILVVANKTWEVEPLIAVVLEPKARPAAMDRKSFRLGYHPAEEPPDPLPASPATIAYPPPRPRLTFQVHKASVEVWCIQDWMRQGVNPSLSYEKFTHALPTIRERAFDGSQPDVVVAFGTAGVPLDEPLNGCVTVGSRVYAHDPWVDTPAEDIAAQVARFGPRLHDDIAQWIDCPIDSKQVAQAAFFSNIDAESRYSAEARMLRTPVASAPVPHVLAGHGFASLGTLNVCDYDDYVWADEETLRRFERHVRQREIGSMETTHALVRLTWPDTPFLFLSGLTDRVPMFDVQVGPRVYAQNFVAAHNGGVVLAFLLPEIVRLLGSQNAA